MAAFLQKPLKLIDEIANRNSDKGKRNQSKNKEDDIGSPTNGSRLDDKESKLDAVDYKVNMPKPMEVNAAEVLNSFDHLYNYLSSRNDAFLATDNFQRRYLYELPKLLWQTEKLEDLGDFVLLFPNPDNADETQANIGISFEEAEENFSKIFETNYTYPYKKKFMTSLKLAYQATFMFDLNKSKRQVRVERIDDIKDLADLIGQEIERMSVEQKHNITPQVVKEKIKKIKDKNLGKSMIRDVLNGGYYMSPKKKAQINLQPESKASSPKTRESSPVFSPSRKRVSIRGIPNDEEQRKAKKDEEDLRYLWPRNPDVKITSDYLTLLRQTTCAILANQGFIIREVFLNNGREIGLVLTLPDSAIKRALLEMGVSRVIEFGIADVLSLEPIDNRFRPLRLNRHLLMEDEWDHHYVMAVSNPEEQGAIHELRQDILSLLATDCEPRHIVRICGGVWTENTFDGNIPVIYDHEKVPIDTWYCYRRFLIELATQLKFIEANKKKMTELLNLHFDSLKIDGEEELLRAKKQKYEAKVDIHKFTVREVVKAFHESHASVASLAKNGEIVIDHEMVSDKPSKRARVTHNLQTIWSFLLVRNKQYYHPYQVANCKMRPKKRFFYDSLWKEYLNASEYELIFEKPTAVALKAFNKVERLKAASYLVNKVINLTQYERYIDQVMIDFDGVKGRLNMLSPLYWIVTRGSRLVPLHNRKELCGIDYQAAFELILGAKEVFDDLHFEHRHYELPVASKSRDQRDSTRKDEVFIELIQQLNGHLHGSDKVTARSNKTARRKYSSESSDQETPKAVISETSNKLVHREAIVEEDKIKESDRFVTTRRKKDITEEEDKLEVNQVDIKVKSPICEEMGDDEVPNRIRKYSPPKKLDLRLKAVNLSFSTIKAGRAKRKKVATRHHHRLIAFGEQRIRELHKKPKQSSQKKIGDAAFYSSCIGSLFLAMKKKKNWLEESFDGDLAHEEDHLPQYRLDFNKTIINRIKVNAKIYKMKNEESTLKNALRNRAPIKNVLPLFFKERVLSEFMDNTEIQVEYPLAKYIRLTFCNNLTKFQEKAFVNYFGEKIALLFAFNNFFRDRLVFIAIVGLLYVAYDIYNRIKNLLDGKTKISADGYYQLLSILFACILTHSKSRFMVAWSTYERNFSERYGQSSIEQTDAPRSQFKGSYIRSVVSDRMNNKMDIRWTRVVKHIVANFLMLVWGAIVGVTCYYLLMTKRFIDSQQYSWDRNIIFGSSGEILTDFIEFIRIKLFDLVFFSIAKRMSTWLNFKFEAEYELDLSLRLSISQFFNNSMIIWLIFYDHLSSTHYKPVSLENGATVYYHWSDVCFGNDCEQELTTYFLVYSLFQLLWAVVFNLAIKTSWSTFIYKFKLLKYFQHLATRADWSLYKFTFGNNKKKANNFNKKTSSIEFSKQLKKGLGANKDADEAAIKKVYQEQAAMYRKPNMEIEKQLFLLEDYTDKDDFDCSSFDYLYMVNSFSYIILYGCIFSHCFATVWLLLASEYSVMRHRLLFVCKRPTPKAASSIGLWFTMMQVVSKMSVFTNALYIAFMVFQVETLAFKLVSLLVSVLVLALIDWVNYLPMFTDKHWTLDLTEKRNAFISNLIDNCGPAIHSKKIIDAAEAINKEIAVKKIEQENEANPKKTKNRSAKRNEELKASKPETKPKDATKSTGNKAEIVIAPNYHRIFEATMTSEQDDILRKQLEEQEEIGYGLLLNLSDFQPDFAPK